MTSAEQEADAKGKAEDTHVVQGIKRVRRANCRGLISDGQNSDANKVPMKVLEKQESTKSSSLEKGHQQNRTGSEATVKRGPGRPRKNTCFIQEHSIGSCTGQCFKGCSENSRKKT